MKGEPAAAIAWIAADARRVGPQGPGTITRGGRAASVQAPAQVDVNVNAAVNVAIAVLGTSGAALVAGLDGILVENRAPAVARV